MSMKKSVAKICFGHLIYITHICIFEVLVNVIITSTKNDILNLKLFWVYEFLKIQTIFCVAAKTWAFIIQESFLIH